MLKFYFKLHQKIWKSINFYKFRFLFYFFILVSVETKNGKCLRKMIFVIIFKCLIIKTKSKIFEMTQNLYLKCKKFKNA